MARILLDPLAQAEVNKELRNIGLSSTLNYFLNEILLHNYSYAIHWSEFISYCAIRLVKELIFVTWKSHNMEAIKKVEFSCMVSTYKFIGSF